MKEREGPKQVREGNKSRKSQKASHHIYFFNTTEKQLKRELYEVRRSYSEPYFLRKDQEN